MSEKKGRETAKDCQHLGCLKEVKNLSIGCPFLFPPGVTLQRLLSPKKPSYPLRIAVSVPTRILKYGIRRNGPSVGKAGDLSEEREQRRGGERKASGEGEAAQPLTGPHGYPSPPYPSARYDGADKQRHRSYRACSPDSPPGCPTSASALNGTQRLRPRSALSTVRRRGRSC